MFLKTLVRKVFLWWRADNQTGRSADPGLTVWADLARLEQLVAHDTEEPPILFTLMNPGGRDFGTDVAAFIDHCCEQQVLRVAAPVTAVGIEATVSGDYRDGGFLIMVTIADRITVASGQLIPEVFRDADDLPRKVLAVVVDIADHAYREFPSHCSHSHREPVVTAQQVLRHARSRPDPAANNAPPHCGDDRFAVVSAGRHG